MDYMASVVAHLLTLPEIAAWPELTGFLHQSARKLRPEWSWPILACQAVGGDPMVALPGAAAIACFYMSIILVDDMLDEDPRGEYRRSGSGPVANMAFALQAAAFRVAEQAVVSPEQRNAVTASLAHMALATALGQHLDVQHPDSEESYWEVLHAKGTPFFASALHVGALLGNAPRMVAAGLRDVGAQLGELIQVQDDLVDAFETPANPDWTQRQPNLPILYARTADHPDRARFSDLLLHVDDPRALHEAQEILIRCGAVSYCAYQMFQRYQVARQHLKDVSLIDPAPIAKLLVDQIQPLVQLLSAVGVKAPSELLELPHELSIDLSSSPS